MTLPVAIACGILFHGFLFRFYWATPWLLTAMMFLTCARISISQMRIKPVHLMLLCLQVFGGIGVYLALRNTNEILAQGLMICMFTPVATASPVIGAMLGADVTLMTTYVLVSNIATAVIAPFLFAAINQAADITFLSSFMHIFQKTLFFLILPLIVSWLMSKFWPKAHNAVRKCQPASFYLWAVCMMILIGSTVHSVVTDSTTNVTLTIIMALSSLILCLILFSTGRKLGIRYGDTIAIRQMMGQKNTGIGVWMTISFLNPAASIVPAAYIVFQNIMNSIEIARGGH